VLAVADGGLMLTLVSGETQLITTDSATRFVRELDATAADLVIGDRVRIQLPRRGFGQGAATDPSAGAPIATQVTLVEGVAE
jgi:hypothetical protein